jgi:pimeloyl-ACP methyl ester carboxylesterase
VGNQSENVGMASTKSRTTNMMKMRDGRELCFSDFGDSNSKPVIYFHGFPGSRLEVQRFDRIAAENHYRLISIDRPGMGCSTMDKNRTILSTVNDVQRLMDYLQLEKISVMGHSGGAAFVAACAYIMPQRLTGAAIVCGMSPVNYPETLNGMTREQKIAFKLVRTFPPLASLMMRMTRLMLNKSDQMMEKMIKPLPEIDQQIFRDPVSGKEIILSTLEAFRNGVTGAAFEMNLLINPWGFALEDIKYPVSLWYGAKDAQVPISNGKLFSSLIQHSTFHLFEQDGHHSLIKNHFEEILNTL